MLNTYEIMFEAFKGSTYSVENINDMGDKAELQIKVDISIKLNNNVFNIFFINFLLNYAHYFSIF